MEYKQKVYAFIVNCEYHMITKISASKYGIVPLFTDSFGISEVESESLEETLKLCQGRWAVREFSTYKELFKYFLDNEEKLDFMDYWGVKNLTGRHEYIEEHSEKIMEIRNKDNDYRSPVPYFGDELDY
jgi:hypothetical protein